MINNGRRENCKIWNKILPESETGENVNNCKYPTVLCLGLGSKFEENCIYLEKMKYFTAVQWYISILLEISTRGVFGSIINKLSLFMFILICKSDAIQGHYENNIWFMKKSR